MQARGDRDGRSSVQEPGHLVIQVSNELMVSKANLARLDFLGTERKEMLHHG